jgi:hypothetical protein
VEDLGRQHRFDAKQPVHRAVTGLIDHLAQPVDVHVVGDPAGRGQLARWGQGTVGDQRERDPLGPLAQPTTDRVGAHRGADAQPAPQRVQHMHPADRTGLGELQPHRRGRPRRGGRVQQPRQRPDQAPDTGTIEVVFAAEGVQHPGA